MKYYIVNNIPMFIIIKTYDNTTEIDTIWEPGHGWRGYDRGHYLEDGFDGCSQLYYYRGDAIKEITYEQMTFYTIVLRHPSPYMLNRQYQAYKLMCDGQNWWTVK